jgi:hypothetical protein
MLRITGATPRVGMRDRGTGIALELSDLGELHGVISAFPSERLCRGEDDRSGTFLPR